MPTDPLDDLDVYPREGIVLESGSSLEPTAFVGSDWIQPPSDWCRSVSPPGILALDSYVDPFTGIAHCFIRALDTVGTATVQFRLGQRAADVPYTVQRLSRVAFPRLDGTSWINSYAIGNSRISYFTVRSENAGTGEVYRLDLITRQIDRGPIQVLDYGYGGAVVLNSQATIAYFAVGRKVIRISTLTNLPVDSVTTDTASVGAVYGAAMGLGDSLMYVGSQDSIFMFDIKARPTLVFASPISGRAVHLAFTTASNKLYATIEALPSAIRRVVEFDGMTGTALRTLPVDSLAQGLALAQDGGRLYVGSESGSLYSCELGVAISCAAARRLPRIWGLALSTDGRIIYGSSGDGSTLRVSESVISVSELTRRFGATTALAAVSLSLPRGAVYGLVGANGAGKTTLIKHILGLLRAESGSVRVFGLDPVADPVGVLSRIGYLSEENDLPGWMRVDELVRYARAFYPAWDDAYAEELRQKFALHPAAKVKTLSKGQKARLGLLLALAYRPELLLLDEPSSGLDPIVRRDILGAVIRTIADEGRTVLFSSHLLDEVEEVADHVTMISHGTIVLSAPLEVIRESHRVDGRVPSLEEIFVAHVGTPASDPGA